MTIERDTAGARAALAESPRDPHRMARLARLLGDAVWQDTSTRDAYYGAAKTLFRRLVKMPPDDPAHLFKFGAVLSDQDQHKKALKVYRKTEAMNWQDRALDFNIGVALMNSSRIEAGKTYMRGASKKPKRERTIEAYFDYHAPDDVASVAGSCYVVGG